MHLQHVYTALPALESNRWAITHVMQDADLQDCVLLALLGVNETLDVLSLGNVPV